MLATAPSESGALLTVPGCRTRQTGNVVLAAIDDDTGAGPVLTHARAEAARLGVPLRVVHVWARRRQRMADADRMTSRRIADHLPPEVAAVVERQLLHDADPVRALIPLSRGAALLVVAAKADGSLGGTASRLIGHTSCPLAIVPPTPVTRGRW